MSTCSYQIQKSQSTVQRHMLVFAFQCGAESLLLDVVLTSDALLAALTSTSRRLLSQPSVSARLSEACQQTQHNPAATLQYLRRHLLVSTWHMRMQQSS